MKKDVTEMNETEFKTAVKRFLDAHNVLHIPYAASRFSKSGIPDTLICHKGLFIAIEFKAEHGDVKRLQRHKINQINNEGGIAFVLFPRDFGIFKKLFTELMRVATDSYEFYQVRDKLIEIGKGKGD